MISTYFGYIYTSIHDTVCINSSQRNYFILVLNKPSKFCVMLMSRNTDYSSIELTEVIILFGSQTSDQRLHQIRLTSTNWYSSEHPEIGPSWCQPWRRWGIRLESQPHPGPGPFPDGIKNCLIHSMITLRVETKPLSPTSTFSNFAGAELIYIFQDQIETNLVKERDQLVGQ